MIQPEWGYAMSKQPNFIARHEELPLKNNSTSLFLQIMVGIAVFLFAVTLSGVLAINTMLQNWNESILGSLTVQIMPSTDVNPEKAAAETIAHQNKALDVLRSLSFVEKADPLTDKQLEKLIQPWLGDGIAIDDLPVPRIIDVKLKRNVDIDFMDLAYKLAQATPMASVDNHKLWLNKLIQFADGIKILALSILALVIMITSGAIFYTTQTSLGLHKYTIEILHQMGAKDTYVAQQYAKRSAILAFQGGVVGLLIAIPTIFGIASLAHQIEGGIIGEAKLSSLDWLSIIGLPAFAAVIAMLTAYYTVKQTLQKLM